MPVPSLAGAESPASSCSARFGRGAPAPPGAGEPGRPRSPAPGGAAPHPPPRDSQEDDVFPLDFALADSVTFPANHSHAHSTESLTSSSPLLEQVEFSCVGRSLSSYASVPSLRSSRTRLADPSHHNFQLNTSSPLSPEPQSFDPAVLSLAPTKRLNRSNSKQLALDLPYSVSSVWFPVDPPFGSSFGDQLSQTSPDLIHYNQSSTPNSAQTDLSVYFDYQQPSSNYEPDSPAYQPTPARRTSARQHLGRQDQPTHRRTQSENYDSFDPSAQLGYTLNGKVRRAKGQAGRMFKCNGKQRHPSRGSGAGRGAEGSLGDEPGRGWGGGGYVRGRHELIMAGGLIIY